MGRCYKWLAKIRSNFLVLGDSIIKFIKVTNQTDIISFPGATIDRLFWKIKLGQLPIYRYKIIIFHVGTNDFANKISVQQILSKLKRLVNLVKYLYSSVIIGISALIPRPCDSESRNSELIELNKHIKSFCHSTGTNFIPTFRRFIDTQTKSIKQALYARDKLHLNFLGAKEIKKITDREHNKSSS